MKKLIIIILLLIIGIILVLMYEPKVANHGGEVIIDTNQEGEVVIPTEIETELLCMEDSDCVLETVIQPACSHTCVGDECTEDLRLCNAYNKYGTEAKDKENMVCIWNEACKEPSVVECRAGKCVVEI